MTRANSRSAAISASASASAATMICGRAFEAMSPTNRPPAASVTGEQALRLFRAFAARLVGCEVLCAGVAPGIDERLHCAPARLDAIGALEQRGVTDHAVVDQRLVAGAPCRFEIILVIERHPNACNDHRWARHLGVESQADAFVRLNAQNQEIPREPIDRRIAEHRE